MQESPRNRTAAADSAPAGQEDLIASADGHQDNVLRRINAHLPRSLGRGAVMGVAIIAAVVGLVLGRVTADPSADPGGLASGSSATDRAAPNGSAAPGLRRGLLTIAELTAIGEQPSGGTYTRGSASVIPDPCSPPDPGDAGVSYVPGPSGATSVSFRVRGGSLTQRVSTLTDERAAQARLRAVVANATTCVFDPGTAVLLGEIRPGLGDEFVAGSVTRGYPSGGSSTVSALLVRVGASLVEFSLNGPSSAAADFAGRCFAISLAGLTR